MARIRVFLSWSGEKSKALAGVFNDWLPDVIQAVEPFYSPDIEKGAGWIRELDSQLKDSTLGILFLTTDNVAAPWLLFEAGALSKSIEENRVCPLLFGIDKASVGFPLAKFQMTEFDTADVRKLLDTVNEALEREDRVSKERLDRSFARQWKVLHESVTGIMKEELAAVPAFDNRVVAQ